MSELIQIQPYSEKSFVLIGNTKPYKDEIKGLGGRWNSRLKDGMKAWIFSNTRKEKVEEFLKTLYPEEEENIDICISIDRVQKEIKFHLDKVEELKKTLSSLLETEKELYDDVNLPREVNPLLPSMKGDVGLFVGKIKSGKSVLLSNLLLREELLGDLFDNIYLISNTAGNEIRKKGVKALGTVLKEEKNISIIEKCV